MISGREMRREYWTRMGRGFKKVNLMEKSWMMRMNPKRARATYVLWRAI